MGTENRDRLCHYDFVVTILWIGFILAISFMEAPLRFQAEDITIPLALQVGKLVFHGLNYAEIAFAIWIFGCQYKNGRSPRTRRRFLYVLTILVVQTLLLFLILDQRTNAIIAHQEVGKAHYHMVYIGLEVAKLIGLSFLGYSQLQDLKSHLVSTE